MNSCELCLGSRELPLLRKRIENNLTRIGLTIPEFVNLDPAERIRAIVKGFGLSEIQGNVKPPVLDWKLTSGDYGLLIVKPEMYRDSSKVKQFLLSELRLPIIFSKDFVYSPRQYWAMYGKYYTENFKQFPHGSLMFLISTSLSSRVLVFKHLDTTSYYETYRYLNQNRNTSIPVTEDRQAIFNTLLIKDPDCGVRKLVCESSVRNQGFLCMEEKCPAVCWDFAGEFKQRGELENLITFNGIHSPRDTDELIDNFAVLSEAVKIQL